MWSLRRRREGNIIGEKRSNQLVRGPGDHGKELGCYANCYKRSLAGHALYVSKQGKLKRTYSKIRDVLKSD